MKKTILSKTLHLLLIPAVFVSCKKNSANTAETTETFSLETSVSPAEGGSVSPEGGAYDEGANVEITASANEGWVFVEWNGDHSDSENPTSVSMDGDMSINALFEKRTYPLTINIQGEGNVDEQIVNTKSTDYTHGTMVELTAVPTDEWRFIEWTGDLDTNENPATITVDQEKNISAVFDFGFNEDFEGDTADNWLFSDDRFSIQDGNLRFSAGPDDNWGAAYYNREYENFKIEAKMTRVESEGTVDNSLTLFIRSGGFLTYEEPVSGYQISITQDGWGSVWRISNGTETGIIPWVPVDQVDEGLGVSNIIAVNINGSKFDIYVNGEHVIGFEDDSFESGFPGIATYAGSNGDNLVLWDYVKLMPAEAPMKERNNKLQITPANSTATGSSSGHE